MTRPPSSVSAEYRPLHKYLKDRYADMVCLTFSEIEDLLGFALPDVARVDRDWWASDAASAPTIQSLSWTQADRSATPNMPARTVVFERLAPAGRR